MSHFGNEKGFTLAELAIVIVVAGILVGGALSLQSLLLDSKMTSTVAQVQSFNSAVHTFGDRYNYLPGDMPGAGTRLFNCPGTNGAACNPAACTPVACTAPSPAVPTPPGAADGYIGNPLWASTWGASAITATSGTTAPTSVDAEKYLFWAHLLMANLISGVNTDGLNTATTFKLDVTNPSTASGGGFVVGYDTHLRGPGSLAANDNTGIAGMVFVQVNDPALALQTTAGKLPLTPQVAAMIDRKMDDGLPSTGFVQAYGVGTSCFTSATALAYNQTVNSKDCGLIYHLSD